MQNIIIDSLLFLLPVIGAILLCVGVYVFLAPAPEKETFSDVETRAVKGTSPFASLDRQGSMWDRFRLFILESFKLERPIEQMHMYLGSPAKPSAVDILSQKILFAIFLPVVFYVITKNVLLAIFAVAFGFYVTDMLLQSKIKKRQDAILANFSTTVDLAALIIESGLDYLTAFDRIIKVAKEKTVLEEELDKMLNEVKLGYSRREALERLANRTGVQEMRSLTGLIIQSDELGTSLVDLLRNFSVDLRFRRLNAAEKLAAQASTKMLVPLFIFIFPTVFILMLSPMLKDMMGGGGFLGF